MSWGSCPSHLSSSLVGIESVESPSFWSQLTRSDDRSCSLMYPGMLELYARSRDTFLRRCLSEPDDSALLSLTMCRSVYPVEASLSLDQSSSSDSAPESLLSEYGCSAAWLSLNSELSSTVAGIPAVLREGCVPAKEASSETLFARAVRLSRPPPWRLSVDLHVERCLPPLKLGMPCGALLPLLLDLRAKPHDLSVPVADRVDFNSLDERPPDSRAPAVGPPERLPGFPVPDPPLYFRTPGRSMLGRRKSGSEGVLEPSHAEVVLRDQFVEMWKPKHDGDACHLPGENCAEEAEHRRGRLERLRDVVKHHGVLLRRSSIPVVSQK
eukprot:scaffold2893_cov254-Pinguiococcus_pyrenoidosus.AAC.25